MRIGRKRSLAASIMDSVSPMPSSRNLLMKSTRRIAFLPTRPTSMMMPRMVKMLRDFPVRARAKSAPIMASGMENITTMGQTYES